MANFHAGLPLWAQEQADHELAEATAEAIQGEKRRRTEVKDYSATVKVTFSLRAQNEEQAAARAERVFDALMKGDFLTKPWLDENMETEIEVEEG